VFGGGRLPLTATGITVLLAMGYGIWNTRRRRRAIVGQDPFDGYDEFYVRNPWRQGIAATLIVGLTLFSTPQEVFAGTPVYQPVFYYYLPATWAPPRF